MRVLGPFVICRSPESFWTFGCENYEFYLRIWAFGYVIDYHRPLPS